MKNIEAIAWAIPPNKKNETRPAKLIHQLTKMGICAENSLMLFHGKSLGEKNYINCGRFVPRLPITCKDLNYVQFSPAFYPKIQHNLPIWIDFYDDWSIAPDINLLQRLISNLSYKWVAATTLANTLITCNSLYMAGKLSIPVENVVPNGVDPEISHLCRSGDSANRLIIFGHFFNGRTDFELISEAINNWPFSEIIIGAPGNTNKLSAIISESRNFNNKNFIIKNWISFDELAGIAGPNTFALIPHQVTDYTLSQDVMKIYQFISLGIKVICPRMLWPAHLNIDYALLIDYGIDPKNAIKEWISTGPITENERVNFGYENSWFNRANAVIKLMG